MDITPTDLPENKALDTRMTWRGEAVLTKRFNHTQKC